MAAMRMRSHASRRAATSHRSRRSLDQLRRASAARCEAHVGAARAIPSFSAHRRSAALEVDELQDLRVSGVSSSERRRPTTAPSSGRREAVAGRHHVGSDLRLRSRGSTAASPPRRACTRSAAAARRGPEVGAQLAGSSNFGGSAASMRATASCEVARAGGGAEQRVARRRRRSARVATSRQELVEASVALLLPLRSSASADRWSSDRPSCRASSHVRRSTSAGTAIRLRLNSRRSIVEERRQADAPVPLHR